ncbi:TPA: hypothetical protein U1B14_002020 [Streptococcus suis]|uniref:hypothetical protein n=1 Tax=Streptococcus suis TaxID=1307 RepID=UPI00209B35A5|nr:hypothetical protein [Streptococcus suis]MCO8207911.1 hypothetical protein [Streptococcus suis]MCO8212331.1 hypothetical protein [Streptococcus suis]MCO8212472.1 hypothetical protein [Streptococcus suis]HEM3492594.1 hypothetical protein [Streptococcus suis]HEM3494885.1 hypothetical protein [Streptococcus suis]
MKTITTLHNGQVQTAAVSWDEFQKLDFKYDTAKNLVRNATKENVDYIKVFFNKAGQVVDSKAFFKDKERHTSLFKKEALKKNGQLTEYASKILNEIFVK